MGAGCIGDCDDTSVTDLKWLATLVIITYFSSCQNMAVLLIVMTNWFAALVIMVTTVADITWLEAGYIGDNGDYSRYHSMAGGFLYW